MTRKIFIDSMLEDAERDKKMLQNNLPVRLDRLWAIRGHWCQTPLRECEPMFTSCSWGQVPALQEYYKRQIAKVFVVLHLFDTYSCPLYN